MSKDEAMKLALEALETTTHVFLDAEGSYGRLETDAMDANYGAITALREALAQRQSRSDVKPLTDEEIEAAFFVTKTEVDNGVGNFRDGVRFVEAAHGIKEQP